MEYTSIEQSKKLIELGLNIETADMIYASYNDVMTGERKYRKWAMELTPMMKIETERELPCWSLSALLEMMPMVNGREPHLIWNKGNYTCFYYCGHKATNNSMIETAYNMVVWLIENNLITEV